LLPPFNRFIGSAVTDVEVYTEVLEDTIHGLFILPWYSRDIIPIFNRLNWYGVPGIRRFLSRIVYPSKEVLDTNVNATLKNGPLFRRSHKG
jgi:hypothetical protein